MLCYSTFIVLNLFLYVLSNSFLYPCNCLFVCLFSQQQFGREDPLVKLSYKPNYPFIDFPVCTCPKNIVPFKTFLILLQYCTNKNYFCCVCGFWTAYICVSVTNTLFILVKALVFPSNNLLDSHKPLEIIFFHPLIHLTS